MPGSSSSSFSSFSVILGLLSLVIRSSGYDTPVARKCAKYPFPEVICINRYGTSLSPEFERVVKNDISDPDTYASTSVPSDSSFKTVADADFLVWDEARASDILGANPSLDYLFTLDPVGHEAPVYVPSTNELYLSQLQRGFLPQFVVNLAVEPPKLSKKTANPPIYAPSGARYRGGLIYFAAAGGNDSLSNQAYRPGIYTLDPKTGISQNVVNNYYGYYFSGCDDLDIDSAGNIWFTDLLNARNLGVDTKAPALEAATYRYNPSTGSVSIVDDSLKSPNGIALSLDGTILYLTDTGAVIPDIDPTLPLVDVPKLRYNATAKRTLYAFDVSRDGSYIQNKRALYLSQEFVPDGLKIARNGYILVANGHGVDVLDQSGVPLVRIQTDFVAANMDFASKNYNELWIVGEGAIARVRWNLKGPIFK